MLAIERMEIPAGLICLHRGVWTILAAVQALHDDLVVCLQIVFAEEKALTGGKEHVSIFH